MSRLLEKQGDFSPPIAVHQIAKDLGIELVERPHLEVDGVKASGFLLRTKGRTICVVNADDHRNRKRFTIAHEIGHFLLHPAQKTYIDWTFYARGEKSSEGTDRQEIEANNFAAELLMPEDFVSSEVSFPLNIFEDEEKIKDLARRFQVSPQAMTHRLTNLRLLQGW